MKQLHIASLFCSALLLNACGGDSSTVDINEADPVPTLVEPSRVQFLPGEGILPLPSDLLFAGTLDGTLEPPDETSAKAAGTAVDLGNPAAAIGTVDGWSASTPMLLTLDMAESSTIDATTVNGESVFLVQTDCQLGLQSCSSFTPLTFGVDFVAQVVSGTNSIAIAPIVPLDAATTYIVGVSTNIQDSRGEAIAGSTFYEQVTRSDVDLSANATLGGLQAAIRRWVYRRASLSFANKRLSSCEFECEQCRACRWFAGSGDRS